MTGQIALVPRAARPPTREAGNCYVSSSDGKGAVSQDEKKPCYHEYDIDGLEGTPRAESPNTNVETRLLRLSEELPILHQVVVTAIEYQIGQDRGRETDRTY